MSDLVASISAESYGQKRQWTILHSLGVAEMALVLGCAVALAAELSPWFDEGWTLSLARNWVTIGHYGHFSMGKPVPSTILNTGFPAVALYALGFKLFGIGVWQARLVSVVVLFLAYLFFHRLVHSLMDVRLADSAVAVSLLAGHLHGHPVFLGVQVLGEMHAVMWLLLAYWLTLQAWTKHRAWLAPAALCYALSLMTKPQVMPFLGVSLGLPLLWVWRRHNALALKRLLSLACAVGVALGGILITWNVYLRHHTLSDSISRDPYAMVRDTKTLFIYVIALSPALRFRILLAVAMLSIGPLAFLGVIWFGSTKFRCGRTGFVSPKEQIVLMVWLLCASWILWYTVLSIGWPRYLAPATFLGSLFGALWLQQCYLPRLRAMLRGSMRQSQSLLNRGKSTAVWHWMCLVLAPVALMTGAILPAVQAKTILQRQGGSHALEEVTDYLNAYMDGEDLLETYESEVFFLLDRNYHYPPDIVQHLANEEVFLGRDVPPYHYDLSVYRPTYLLLGPAGRLFKVYEEYLRTHVVTEVLRNARYVLYKLP